MEVSTKGVIAASIKKMYGYISQVSHGLIGESFQKQYFPKWKDRERYPFEDGDVAVKLIVARAWLSRLGLIYEIGEGMDLGNREGGIWGHKDER